MLKHPFARNTLLPPFARHNVLSKYLFEIYWQDTEVRKTAYLKHKGIGKATPSQEGQDANTT